MRLALIHTNDFGFTGWEIHTTECDHVTKSIRRGTFVVIDSAESPGAFIESEIAARAEEGMGDEDFTIMPCWVGADKCISSGMRPNLALHHSQTPAGLNGQSQELFMVAATAL
jgi:hypothetical protein